MSVFSELNMYMRDISQIPLLAIEEEHELAVKVFQGDREARDKLIQSNLRFVITVAHTFKNRGVSFADLVSEGNLGLIRAADSFDPKEEVRFVTYADFWIKQAMRRIIINQGSTVRLPSYLVKLISKWSKVEKLLTLNLGRQPMWEEIKKHLSLSEKREAFLLHAKKLDQGNSIANTLNFSLAVDSAEEKLMEVDDLAYVLRLINKLDKRQANLMQMRYGLHPYTEVHTLQEVGEKLGISRQRVQQIESETLNELAAFFRQNS